MSSMHISPYSSAFIGEVYLDPFKVSYRKAAASLNVSPSTFNRLVMGKSNISPESWLAMQDHYDLWQTQSRVNLDEIKRMVFA